MRSFKRPLATSKRSRPSSVRPGPNTAVLCRVGRIREAGLGRPSRNSRHWPNVSTKPRSGCRRRAASVPSHPSPRLASRKGHHSRYAATFRVDHRTGAERAPIRGRGGGLAVLQFTPNPLSLKPHQIPWFTSKWLILLVKHGTLNQRVQGSNPCTPTNVFNNLYQVPEGVTRWGLVGVGRV